MRMLLALLLVNCSGTGGDAQARYARATECEVLVGFIAAANPELSRAQLVRFRTAYEAYHRRTEALGTDLGKSAQQIEADRRVIIPRLREQLWARDADSAIAGLIGDAERCAAEIG